MLDDTNLDIPATPADRAADAAHLTALANRLQTEAGRALGFPVQTTTSQSHLAPLLDVVLNNLGDVDSDDATGLHSKRYERAVIDYLARLVGADPADTYGYVAPSTSHALLWALYTARTRLRSPAADSSSPALPVYLSAEAHHSVRQAADVLDLTPVIVPTGGDHAMDPAALAAAVAGQAARGRPDGILLATVGTTMWGAVDDVAVLRQTAARHGADRLLTVVDGALGGWTAAGLGLPIGPAAGTDILVLSAHKMLIPTPAGLILARRDLVTSTTTAPYLGTMSATLGCSRDGLLALRVWDALRALGDTGLRTRIRTAVITARWAERQLHRHGWRPWRHPASTTIVIARPDPTVVDRWRLATDGEYAHLIIGPHATRPLIRQLLADLGDGPAAVPPIQLRPGPQLRRGIPYGWSVRIAPDLAYGVTYDLGPTARVGDPLLLCVLYGPGGSHLRIIGRPQTLAAARRMIRRHLLASRTPGTDLDTLSRAWEARLPPRTAPAPAPAPAPVPAPAPEPVGAGAIPHQRDTAPDAAPR